MRRASLLDKKSADAPTSGSIQSNTKKKPELPSFLKTSGSRRQSGLPAYFSDTFQSLKTSNDSTSQNESKVRFESLDSKVKIAESHETISQKDLVTGSEPAQSKKSLDAITSSSSSNPAKDHLFTISDPTPIFKRRPSMSNPGLAISATASKILEEDEFRSDNSNRSYKRRPSMDKNGSNTHIRDSNTDDSGEFVSENLTGKQKGKDKNLDGHSNKSKVEIDASEYMSLPSNFSKMNKNLPSSNFSKLEEKLKEAKTDSKGHVKSEINELLKRPIRNLPPALMEKYAKRSTISFEINDESLASERPSIVNEQISEQDPNLDNEADKVLLKRDWARKKWKLGMNGVCIGLYLVNFYFNLREKQKSLYKTAGTEAEGIAFLLSSHVAKPDAALSAKLRELTSKADRSEADIEALERILTIRIRSFGRFTTDQRLKFCRILQYENFDGERTIVREGHVSWAFYFILSGQVEIYKVKNGIKYRLNVMNAGASFGDRTMNLLNDKRTASVGSTMEVELIRIDKSDFFDITNVKDEKSMASRSAKLLQIPHFSSAPGGFVERITPFTQIITFEPNEYILREGVANYKLFWLVKGTCTVVKTVPFVKKLLNSNYAGKTYKILPIESGAKASEDEELFKENLTIHEMDPGENFPEIRVPHGDSREGDLLYLNKKEYLEQLKKEEPDDESTKAYVSVVAKTKVEVVSVNQTDYADYATNDMLLSIINSKSIFRVPIKRLQESYLEQRQWNTYKKKLVSEVAKKK